MKTIASLISTALLLGLIGCASSHESGVKSDLRTQWTTVMADTKTTADAAREVLEAHELKNVTASATAVDGVAKGKMADGTKVNVDIKKKSDTTSEVSVTVGTLGDPKLGADLAKQIKLKAEGK